MAGGCCRDRGAIEEAARRGAFRVVAEKVELCIFAQFDCGVDEELDVVLDIRLTPIVWDFVRIRVDGLELVPGEISGVNHGLHVVTNHRSNSAFNVVDFAGYVYEPGVTQRKAGVGRDAIVVTITFKRRAIVGLHFNTFGIVSQDEVDHAGNGIGTIL